MSGDKQQITQEEFDKKVTLEEVVNAKKAYELSKGFSCEDELCKAMFEANIKYFKEKYEIK